MRDSSLKLNKTKHGTYIDEQRSSILHRKEAIQPHLPIRLPCYDFTPIICPTQAAGSKRLPHRLRALQTRGVTGGVRPERIHRGIDPRLLAIPASCRRVATTIRTENGFMRLAPPRGLATLVPSIARSPGHKA